MPRPRGRKPKQAEPQPQQEEAQEATVETPATEPDVAVSDAPPPWQAAQITAEQAAEQAAAMETPPPPLNVPPQAQGPAHVKILNEPTVTGPVSQGDAWASADLGLPEAIRNQLRQTATHGATFPQGMPSMTEVGDESDLAREEFRSSSAKCYILVSPGIPARESPTMPGQMIPGTPVIDIDFQATPQDNKAGHYITPDFAQLTHRYLEYFMARDPKDAMEKSRATAAFWIRALKAKLRNHKYFKSGMIRCLQEDVTQSYEAQLRASASIIEQAGGDPQAVLAQLPKVTGQAAPIPIQRGGVTPREQERDATAARMASLEEKIDRLSEALASK